MNTSLNLGFVTVLAESGSYLGGYLVTNAWGRPLEFRLTTAVQPNRIQHVLYGKTLRPYVYADVLGKALLDKASLPVEILITDCEPLLDLRLQVATPVAWLADEEDTLARSLQEAGAGVVKRRDDLLLCHPRFANDARPIRDALDRASAMVELSEPFERIREALSEARKMGVTARGA